MTKNKRKKVGSMPRTLRELGIKIQDKVNGNLENVGNVYVRVSELTKTESGFKNDYKGKKGFKGTYGVERNLFVKDLGMIISYTF